MSDAEIYAEVKSEQQEVFEYIQKFIPNYRRLVINQVNFPSSFLQKIIYQKGKISI